MPLTSISVAMSRCIFDEMQGFPEGIKLGEDFLLWIRIALKYKVVFLNKPLAYYNQDIEQTNRGVVSKGYAPDTFMTFHFDQFEKIEKENYELKVLLDRLRVYSLLRFRLTNSYRERVKHEIAKVDFSNVDKWFWFCYKLPYPFIWIWQKMRSMASSIKYRGK